MQDNGRIMKELKELQDGVKNVSKNVVNGATPKEHVLPINDLTILNDVISNRSGSIAPMIAINPP